MNGTTQVGSWTNSPDKLFPGVMTTVNVSGTGHFLKYTKPKPKPSKIT